MSQTTPSFTLRGQILSAPKMETGLYLVSTPIGNLGDITLRALETLAGCDVIACEDTRTSGVLLKRYGIDRPKISYNEHNAVERGRDLIRQIEDGAAVCIISDAGTPLVSDPGFRLVRDVAAKGFAVIPIPGASAPLAALVGSGLANDDFRFIGFLPNKAQARSQQLSALSQSKSTLMFFESPTRLVASLKSMAEQFGNERRAVVARELTKIHETFHRGMLEELVSEFSSMEKVRGEIVVVVAGADEIVFSPEHVEELLRAALIDKKTKQAANEVAEQTGLSKQELYAMALQIKHESSNA